MTSADSCRMGEIEDVGTVGLCWRWGNLWEWNGLSWEHFVENQCGARRGRDRRSDLVETGEGVGGRGEPQTEPVILSILWNLSYDKSTVVNTSSSHR